MFKTIESAGLRRRIKNHVIARQHVFFAVVQPGFEKIAAAELSGMGLLLKDEFIEGGVEFTGKLDSCYRACLSSRTASRIMMRTAEFRTSNFFELERTIRSFPWELYIGQVAGLKFRTSTVKSMIYHTGKLEEIFHAGIKSRLESAGTEYAGNGEPPAQTVFLRNIRDTCTVSLDASGEFMYKRTDSKLVTKATLRETTASLILLAAGIHGYEQILDPMCGSGTFSIEAASVLTDTPPGYERKFHFMNWPCFREDTFRFIKNSAMKNVIPQEMVPRKIFTSDIDPEAVRIARLNVPERFSKIVEPQVMDFFSLAPDSVKEKKTLIILNPPYGKRLDEGEILSLYRETGEKIRKDLSGCGYAIIVPGKEKERALNIPYDRRIQFMNGGIKVAVLFKDI